MLHTALLQLNTLSVFDVAQSTVTAEHCQCTMPHRAPLQLNALSVNTLSVYDAAQSTVTAEHTVSVWCCTEHCYSWTHCRRMPAPFRTRVAGFFTETPSTPAVKMSAFQGWGYNYIVEVQPSRFKNKRPTSSSYVHTVLLRGTRPLLLLEASTTLTSQSECYGSGLMVLGSCTSVWKSPHTIHASINNPPTPTPPPPPTPTKKKEEATNNRVIQE